MEKENIDSYKEAQEYLRDHVDNPKMFKHPNRHTLGYKWRVIWFKKEYMFAFKHHWNFKLSKRGAWTFINNLFKENRDLIFNIVESKYSLKK